MGNSQNKKGIVIAVPQKYEAICLKNLQKIRELGCNLPIEIWEIGNEISDKSRKLYQSINGLSFKDVHNFTDNSAHWKGFQVKAFILYHTQFEEALLCDADIIFHQNPEILFNDVSYLETGTYFFKDLDKWQFTKLNNKAEQFKQKFFYKKFKNLNFFNKRKAWIKSLLPNKTDLFPKEWDYIYDNKIPQQPVKEALQESGVVLLNKKARKKSLEIIYSLNNNHQETYKYIWGDKETFWLGCVMANEAFYFNESYGYICETTGHLTHDYNGNKFFSQKGD